MAVGSYDATTGRPIFPDSGAPDVGVDPTEVGKYAAEVGNRIVKADLAALNAYAYKRAGLMGHALDTKTDYVHSGSGWVKVLQSAGGIISATTTAGGVVQVTHGMGKTPIAVNATMVVNGPVIPTRLKAQIGTVTSTTIDVVILRNDTGDAVFASNPVQFHWIAVA